MQAVLEDHFEGVYAFAIFVQVIPHVHWRL
jgi:hypothetical protein